MSLILDVLSWFLLLGGAFFGVMGAIGTIRFPDFYTRVHASSVADTLCAAMIILGLVLQAGFTLITVKLLFIWAFLWYTGPVASHAMVRAAHHMGLQPYLVKQPEDGSSDTGKENESSTR